jgi:uncharacterized membrane protein YkvA (DUF1232 family)
MLCAEGLKVFKREKNWASRKRCRKEMAELLHIQNAVSCFGRAQRNTQNVIHWTRRYSAGDTYAVYLLARHPRTPWYAKGLAAAAVACALSPFDLIPDFIPVLGYPNDLIIVPFGIAAVLRLVPADVLADCR